MTVFGGDVILASDINTLETAIENRKELIDQLTADSSGITSTSLSTVLTVTLPAVGTYAYDVQLLVTNTVAVGRPGFGIGGTSTPTAWRWASHTTHYNTATASQGVSASGTSYPSTGTALVNSDFTTTAGWSPVRIKGQVTVSAAGTLTFRLSEASGAGTVIARSGSIVTARMTA